MNLEHVRHLLKTHQGAIKAWALYPTTLDNIARELGIDTPRIIWPVTLFDIPCVSLEDGQPEGVIV